MRRYILTGTPGAGKTSLIQSLQAAGYPVVAEAATDVIAQQAAKGISEPWKESNFLDLIVHVQKQRLHQEIVSDHRVQFHDRSVFCTYALAQYLNVSLSAALLNEIERVKSESIYDNNVFFIENIGFCQSTTARKISFEDSLKFEEIHRKVYEAFGFNLISISSDSVLNRLSKIMGFVKANGRPESGCEQHK